MKTHRKFAGLATKRWTIFANIFLLALTIFIPNGVTGVETRMENQFEKCCGLGKSWASEGLRCEKFMGPVNGVPRVEQGLCLEAVDICCVRAYHEKSCAKGKEDARAGLACVQGNGGSKKSPCPSDQQRDCCEACKLGILTGSMGQGCAFKSFTFGKPWDPAFLECCHEASPTTTNSDESASTTIFFTEDSSSTSLNATSTSVSTDVTSDSTSPDIPTPGLDDICELMKGLLCSDICVPTSGSFYCKCPEGSVLLNDGKTCRKNSPEDRCNSKNPCSQVCTDTGTGVTCSCNTGFVLADDKRTCSPISTRLAEPSEDNELSPRCPPGYEYNKTAQVCDDIDECEKSPCPGECRNAIGSFICLEGETSAENEMYEPNQETCPPGYQWDPLAQLCTDIDECLELNPACNAETHLCANTQGSFTCHKLTGPKGCPAGFKYDIAAKICRDVDECLEAIHGCLPESEECRNIEGGYECDVKCRKGFAFNRRLGVCSDIDECTETLHPCPDPDTRCRNNLGGYECKKIVDIDATGLKAMEVARVSKMEDCTGEKTGGEGCSRTSDDNSIEIGRPIEKHQQAASREPEIFASPDHARFVIGDAEKYQETRTKSIRRLGMRSCPDGAYYNREMNSCECLAGYQIDPVNGECRDASANATSRTASYSRTDEPCQPGYKREGTVCRDIDECLEGPGCRDNEDCQNSNGGYECSPRCSNGWRYDHAIGNCADVDECLEGRDDCPRDTHRCVNGNGTYACEEIKSCGNGYRRIYNGSCVDIDECVEGPGCREHERCKNLNGRYDCEPLCSKGWRFDTARKGCLDVDECQLGLHDCPQTTHRCVNTNGTYACQLIPPCNSGFRKLFNGSCVDIDECVENLHDCQLAYHRYCVNREGTYECVTRYPECSKGYEYSLRTRGCQDIDECKRGDFNCDSRFNERCVNLPGSYRCERPVTSGYGKRRKPACPTGYRYDTAKRECSDIDECTEGLHTCGSEVCHNEPGGYSCARARVPVEPTRQTPSNQENPSSGQNCRSGTRYVRNRGCVDIDECQEDEEACSSNEECVNRPGSFTCQCKLGFRRDNLTQACVDINECQLLENDCLSTQRCDNTLGSYNCVRYLPCGTGYTLNAATEICEDDDECVLGTHDCSSGYHCRNTLGSYRCDKNRRAPSIPGAGPFPSTAKIVATTPAPVLPAGPRGICPRGFVDGANGQCVDVDECARGQNLCARTLQKCVNTLGSYRCVSRVLCGNGYSLDPSSGSHCVDVDECAEGTHECGPGQTCQNRQGGYICECPPGHVVGPNKDCVDIDECSFYGSQSYGSSGGICGTNSRCENTPGSYRCICEPGFENVAPRGQGPGICQDVDECASTPGLCQHECVNAWGSYRCACKPGFRLNRDNRSCTDIDECVEFKDNNLCVGICENTPGSYACSCPNGYKLSVDGRTCQDIDECASGRVCRDPSEMCQNTRGSFRCNRIDCPSGYYRDPQRKNRCVRTSLYCPSGDLACFRAPSHYSYNFITFVSMLPIPSTGVLELFTMRGTHLPGSTVEFSMALVDARAPPGVTRATESCFALRRPAPSQVVLVMTRSIPGPQEIELDLSMEIYHNTAFAGSAVAKLFIFVSQYEF